MLVGVHASKGVAKVANSLPVLLLSEAACGRIDFGDEATRYILCARDLSGSPLRRGLFVFHVRCRRLFLKRWGTGSSVVLCNNTGKYFASRILYTLYTEWVTWNYLHLNDFIQKSCKALQSGIRQFLLEFLQIRSQVYRFKNIKIYTYNNI